MREEKRRLKKEAFYSDLSEIEEEYHRRALKLAEESDIVLFVGGLDHEYDIEGEDRPCMKLPYHQDELITKLLKVRPDTIVTLIGGSPVEMPWEEKSRYNFVVLLCRNGEWHSPSGNPHRKNQSQWKTGRNFSSCL